MNFWNLTEVLNWLYMWGTPVGKLVTETVTYPGGQYLLTTVKFEHPSKDLSDIPDWVDTTDRYVAIERLLCGFLGPGIALTDMRERGLAWGKGWQTPAFKQLPSSTEATMISEWKAEHFKRPGS